ALAVLDWEGAASQAHQLKGLAGIYGASSVAKLLRQIEIVVEGRDVAALEPLVSELDGQIRSATKTP
ncbi:MAG: Hpt domain-containing protein, partial [Pseudomonadota bacterium]